LAARSSGCAASQAIQRKNAMKEPSIEAVPRRRRYGWWIAGGIFAVLIALPLGTVIYYAKPIGVVYNIG
jgi:hypothetical protein